MKTITINVPDDCEVQIVKKEEKEEKKEPVIRTYQDLIKNRIRISGYNINTDSSMSGVEVMSGLMNRKVAATEKVAKSMLAMAMISQLFSYYGGAITDEEWKEISWTNKYTIDKIEGNIVKESWTTRYNFLAFHTAKQRDNFLKYNEQLVKDYLMID